MPRDLTFVLAALFLVRTKGGIGLAAAYSISMAVGFALNGLIVLRLFYKPKQERQNDLLGEPARDLAAESDLRD